MLQYKRLNMKRACIKPYTITDEQNVSFIPLLKNNFVRMTQVCINPGNCAHGPNVNLMRLFNPIWVAIKKYAVFLLLLCSVMGCQIMFEEDELNKVTYHTTDDVEFGLAGMYYSFATIAKDASTFGYIFANADDVNYGDTTTNADDQLIPGEEHILLIYKPLYKTIACANGVLKKSESLNQNSPEVQHLLGEAYFMRAYAYFWLVRVFGQVMIIDNVDVDYNVKKASFSEIYSFIVRDLRTAINLLPASSNQARVKYVTPHRGSAKALLAEVYLTGAGYPLRDTKMYAEAAKIAGDVVDSAAYFGMGLMDDLADLWNGKNEINKESIFSMYATGSKLPHYYPDSEKKQYAVTDIYFSCPRIGWIGMVHVAAKFFNTFPNGYRKNMTYQNRFLYVYSPPCIVDSLNPATQYCPPSETMEVYKNSKDLGFMMFFRKYYTRFDMPDSLLYLNNYYYGYGYGIDDYFFLENYGNVIYCLRYAHTLLTYAESKARSGQLDASAYEAVNQVRRRANKVNVFAPSVYDLKPGLSPEQFCDSVVSERGWEFCAEPEGRYFDLLRLDRLSKLADYKYPRDGHVYPVRVNMETYFWPLPQTDIMLNPNLE